MSERMFLLQQRQHQPVFEGLPAARPRNQLQKRRCSTHSHKAASGRKPASFLRADEGC